MDLNKQQSQLTPQGFIQSIKQFSFQQRFFKWQSYIKQLKQAQSSYFEVGLQKFIQYYPFNHTYWMMLIQHILSRPKSKALAVKTYQLALLKNSRSITLWRNYLSWLKDNISKSDPNYLRGQYQKATKIIGTHYHADFVFQQYFSLETDIIKKYQTMKKALVSPLKQIDKIYDIIATYIDESEQLIVQILENIAKIEQLQINQPKHSEKYKDEVKLKIKTVLRKLYQPTKMHVQQRYQFESKITSDEYRPYEGSYQVWKNYLHFIKNSGNVEFVYPLYERALIALCDKQTLWQDYFLILQSQSNYNRALYLLRSHATFFQTLSRQITYYWLEIQQREKPQRARELYIELEKQQKHLEAFMRHIQLELRAKEYNNAKALYQTILTVFTANVDVIAYVVVQYAEFIIKYFRDVEFSKKILKNYFHSSPYNQYLFLNYLQFFINHVEYKENVKNAKQIYEDFLNIASTGLIRALQNTPEKYKTIKKITLNYLRNYITSIYSIKAAEKKIKQAQINAKNNNESLKRPLPAE